MIRRSTKSTNTGFVLLHLLGCALALQVSSTAGAEDIKATVSEAPAPNRKYVVSGNRTDAFLNEVVIPDTWGINNLLWRWRTEAVFIDQPGPYPLPFSRPVVMVTVTKESSFSIIVAKVGGAQIDSFEFKVIGPGVYRFGFEKPIWPAVDSVVQLEINGAIEGEQLISTACLNGLK